ncbi:MAG: preprotein translocase subunit SecG, partial [Burkholderiaceae bacterium]
YLGSKHNTVNGGVLENLPSTPTSTSATPAPTPAEKVAAPAAASPANSTVAPANAAGQSNQIPK